MDSCRSGESLGFPAVRTGDPQFAIAALENSASAPSEDGDLSLLFDRYSRLVHGTARRVLGDPIEAEEVVQEVFLYLYRKAELFDPSKGSLKAWIIQITFCRALDRKSYLARRRLHVLADADLLKLRGETDLERDLEAKLSRKHLEKAFAELTAMQRRTVELFYFEGLALREIGQQLEQPLGSVRHHLYRGLERLRKSVHLLGLRRKRK